MSVEYKNVDCIELMKTLADKQIDLAIVDPPYFKGPNTRVFYGPAEGGVGGRKDYGTIKQWEVPGQEYFEELFRISKNQIVWGCNYYDYNFGPGRIIWDKVNGNSPFSDCEIAYCSLHDSARLFRYMWNGMMQGKSITEGHIMQGKKELNEKRIHPTQKPVNLYKWLLMKYAKEGDLILDTHTGSASSIIACYDMGFDVLASELDKQMYIKSKERIDNHISQIKLF